MNEIMKEKWKKIKEKIGEEEETKNRIKIKK